MVVYNFGSFALDLKKKWYIDTGYILKPVKSNRIYFVCFYE